MTRLRLFPLIALVLALVAGSISMATARHLPGAAGVVELCTSDGTATILVDARGNPITPAHPCPDCIPGLAALTDPTPPAVQAPITLVPLRWTRRTESPRATRSMPPFRSRAPPVVV